MAVHDSQLWISAARHNERRGGVYYLGLSQMELSDVLNPDALQFRSEFGAGLAAGNGLVAVGHDNYEGAVFPVQVTGEGIHMDEVIFNTASEIASILERLPSVSMEPPGMFPCAEVDIISFLTRQEIGARRGIQVNDVWGWEDPETRREYALVGRTDGPHSLI